MTQGRSNREVSRPKGEPMAHAVSPAAVSDIGAQVVRTISKPLYKGRGYEAPMNKSQSHSGGSQGTY